MTNPLSVLDRPHRVIELGHPLSPAVPVSPSHVGFSTALTRRHGDRIRDDGGSGASEMIVTSSHVGTHIDALSHASVDGRLHGGIDAIESQRGPGGFRDLGAETIPPFICTAVLLDLPAVLGELDGGYEITPDDLDRASAGLALAAAEVILIRTGWSRHWADPAQYVGQADGAPGVGVQGGGWLAERSPRAVGSDTMAFECIPPGVGHRNLPVHSSLLVGEGIYVIENLDLDELSATPHREFLFILTPLRIVGATGSPVRPLAIVSDDG